MIRVEGYKNLYRDEKSGAIINCDTASYNQHMNALNYRQNQKKELEKMKEDIDEIKSLLKELIDKK